MVRGGRDEAGLQPSEDQFWPLPWGVGCNVGGCQEAVWFGCGFVSFLFHFQRKILPFYLGFIVLAAALFLFRNLT